MLRESPNHRPESRMYRIVATSLVWVAVLAAGVPAAFAGGQGGYPGGGIGGMGMPGGRNGMGPTGPPMESPASSSGAVAKPDKVAQKAFDAGVKSLNRAKEYEDIAAKATDPDKKGSAMEKVGDAYDRALDQFTEVLRNKADMYEAWNFVGNIHLRLGAYREAIDDYNHTLAIKADFAEAIEHRAEAYLAIDRLEEVQSAYMDLFNHERALADRLMAAMQKWLEDHRASANGMRAADIDSFGKWLQERDSVAKQTASAAP